MKSGLVLLVLVSVISAVFSGYSYNDEDSSVLSFGRPVDVEKRVKLFLCWSETGDRTEYDLKDFEKILEDENFDVSKPTMIYFHGFLESSEVLSVKTVVDAYLKLGGYNIIIVDWYEFSTGLYVLKVLRQLSYIGQFIARYMTIFIDTNYSAKKIHFIGHSMGGQLAGLVARLVKQQTREKSRIGRITGLDPAGPGFQEIVLPGSFPPLSREDGDFVDIIHTDMGFYGFKRAVGSVDFYPNGGHRYQPGCKHWPLKPDENQSGPFGFCSHWKSWQYYALTVLKPSIFEAVKCDSWENYIQGQCDGNDKMVMGYGTLATTTGIYYLEAIALTQFSDLPQ